MSNKIKKKQLKQVQNQAQEGRSMVEMLGVLAIIGVLSIGGIAGYRWGMDKHVSNQILYEMNLNSAQLAMLLQKGNPDGVTLSLGSPYDEGKFRTVDYGFAYACGEEASFGPECLYLDETMYSMTATGLPKRVCNMLGDAVFGMAYYYDSEINGGDNECNDTGNTVTVFFDTDTTVEGGIPRPEESETHTPVPEVTEPTTTELTTLTSPTTASTTTTPPETTTTSKCNGGGTTMLDNEEVCWCGGWGGENCTYTDLAEPCHYRGLWCGPGCICDVPGWGGRDCSIPMSSFCNNHGVIGVGWKNDSSWVSNTCYCNNGWSGANCETCTGSDNECKCNGHGSWDNNNSRCVCNEPWCGTDCSQVSSNYCGEHGTWWSSGRCQCRPGWYGDNCDKCNGQGTAYNANTGKCTCKSGYSGDDCKTQN